MVGVEQWAEIRRAHFIEGVGIRELARRTGLDRQTIRRAIRADATPPTSGGRSPRSSTPTRRRSTASFAPTRASRPRGSAR
jgi:hypothetical protein